MMANSDLPADPFHSHPCSICETERLTLPDGSKICPKCDRAACGSCGDVEPTGKAVVCLTCGAMMPAFVPKQSASVHDPKL